VVVVLQTEEQTSPRKGCRTLLETVSLIRRPKSRRGLEHRIKAQLGESGCTFVQGAGESASTLLIKAAAHSLRQRSGINQQRRTRDLNAEVLPELLRVAFKRRRRGKWPAKSCHVFR